MASKSELVLGVVQFALDLVGVVDPTGVADATSALISLGRGKWLDAAISGASLIPYIGDLAKTGKLPRYAKTITDAIELARKDHRFALELRPALVQLDRVLDKTPVASLPGSAQTWILKIREEIRGFLQRKMYHPNSKHEVSGAIGLKGTKLDLTSDQAYALLNDSIHCLPVPGKKQFVGVRDGKVYVFQPDAVGGYHAYPSSGNEIATKYPTVANRIAVLVGVDFKRFSRMN